MPEDQWVPDELEPEADQIREVYAWFGLAIYGAQLHEQTMAYLLATVFGPGDEWLPHLRLLIRYKRPA